MLQIKLSAIFILAAAAIVPVVAPPPPIRSSSLPVPIVPVVAPPPPIRSSSLPATSSHAHAVYSDRIHESPEPESHPESSNLKRKLTEGSSVHEGSVHEGSGHEEPKQKRQRVAGEASGSGQSNPTPEGKTRWVYIQYDHLCQDLEFCNIGGTQKDKVQCTSHDRCKKCISVLLQELFYINVLWSILPMLMNLSKSDSSSPFRAHTLG
jgi:hypothetical protein